jgi:hypothetical protein
MSHSARSIPLTRAEMQDMLRDLMNQAEEDRAAGDARSG